MNDDAVPLQTLWVSDSSVGSDNLKSAVEQVLTKDREARTRDRRIRVGGIAALALLVPVLVWAAAHGVAPLIRGAYALMAVGCVAMAAAEWQYLEWSRQALPGPTDARSQLQKAAFILARQIRLIKTASVWSSPIFLAVALITVWLYLERTHAAAYTLGGVVGALWIVAGVKSSSASATLNNQRLEMERLLDDLQ